MRLRFFAFYGLMIFAFGVLFLRLFDLMLVRGESNLQLSEGQRMRLKKISAPRGIIFDQKGKPLVRNVPLYKKCDLGDKKEEKCQFLTHDEALKLEAENHDADLVTEVGREYLFGEATAHLLGYLSETTAEEVASGRWQSGQLIGRLGIESEYEDLLGGVDGGELVEVDTYGKVVRKVGKRDPQPGQNINLWIDVDLQQIANRLMEGKKGAVVVQDMQGHILTLVSSPSYNPSFFMPVQEDKDVSLVKQGKAVEILNDTAFPMFNRAISGVYPPGSTFKIVVSSAGLEENTITGESRIEDTGQITVGTYQYKNWFFTSQGGTEGQINVVRALARSTDTFFYKLGEMIGPEKIVEWAKKYGAGQSTGIDLAGENKGFVPDPKMGDWFLGNTYHLSIGQGSLGLTPLQVNRMISVIANGGKLCPAKIKKDEKEEDKCVSINLKPETIALIKEGMKEACSVGGTAGSFSVFPVPVACKTGTAEFNDPKGKTHAWFTAFAPIDNPKIVITVVVEAGGEGSSVAAPIAKEVLREYFKNSSN
ncbi:MAG: penicillin-binding transpeptidase domain-containing protein [Patescibacteria group bacterium]|nr:penicillin-binding transpeptidase domain-containing protein [Patescibacteria group bacterium]